MAKKDLFIIRDEGYLGKDKTNYSIIYRVRVVDEGGKIVDKVNGKDVEYGFGIGPTEAIQDFIHKNDSKIIDEVFDAILN